MSRRRNPEQGDGRHHDRNRDRNRNRDRGRDRKSVASLEPSASGKVSTSHDADSNESGSSEAHHNDDDSIISGDHQDFDRSHDDDIVGSSEDNNRHEGDSRDPVISGGYDPSGDGDHGYTDDAYRFDFIKGQVANLRQFDSGRWKSESIDSDEAWSFDGTSLVMTEREHDGNQITTFTDPNGDGIFTMVSQVHTGI